MFFNADGRLTDESTRKDLAELLAALSRESAAASRLVTAGTAD